MILALILLLTQAQLPDSGAIKKDVWTVNKNVIPGWPGFTRPSFNLVVRGQVWVNSKISLAPAKLKVEDPLVLVLDLTYIKFKHQDTPIGVPHPFRIESASYAVKNYTGQHEKVVIRYPDGKQITVKIALH